MNFTIYSQNCCSLPFTNKSKRFRRILSNILTNQLDIVFLQEIFFKKDLALCLNYLENNYYVTYSERKNLINGGLVILVRKEILNNSDCSFKFIKFKEQGSLVSLQTVDKLMHKGYLYLYLKSLDIYFVNVHSFSSYLFPNLEKKVIKQLEEVDVFVKKKRCFIAGDFNTCIDKYLSTEPCYYNLTPNIKTYRIINKQLDYILACNLNILENTQSECVYSGSDHLGLISKFKF